MSARIKIYDNQANNTFDTAGTYNNATGRYIIPTGYSGWWEVDIKIYMLTYTEGAARVSLQRNSGTVANQLLLSGDFQGQRGDFSSYIQVNEGDEMFIYQEQNSSTYSFFTNRTWWQMHFISSSL